MIPKTIHQIWIGNLEPPVSLMNSWKNKNPGFKYILWDEERIRAEKFASQVKIDEIEEYCGKADIIRYEILNRQCALLQTFKRNAAFFVTRLTFNHCQNKLK